MKKRHKSSKEAIKKFKKVVGEKTNESEKEITKSFNEFKKGQSKKDLRLSDAVDEIFLDDEYYPEDDIYQEENDEHNPNIEDGEFKEIGEEDLNEIF